ncbi:MAG: hypothetical protein U0441_24435 [Polyangiaceae bacterium]
MKRSVLVAASILSLALPALVTDMGSVAHAQQPAPTDQVTEAARQKYQEGVKAFEAGKYEDARSAFLQAYALKRVPAVLLNLGQSEIKSSHWEDGGNHLQQFIRDHKGATPDQISAAQAGIAEAKKKTGHVVVIVNAVGADLSLDGLSIGKSPLLDPYFVKPGKHVLYASYQGSAATAAVDVQKGIATSATLTLAVTTAPTATVPTAPVPTTTAPAPTYTAPVPTYTAPAPTATYTGPAPTYPYPTGTAPYIPPATNDPLGPPVPTGTVPGPDTGGKEPLFTWFQHKPLAWIGAGAAVIGLGLGVGFSAAAGTASGNVNSYRDLILKQANAVGITGSPCGPENDPSKDDPRLIGTDSSTGQPVNACDKLRQSLGQYRADVGVAATGWVLFGLGAIGTVTYALIDWYPKQKSTAKGPQILGVAPAISPTQQGIGVVGVF